MSRRCASCSMGITTRMRCARTSAPPASWGSARCRRSSWTAGWARPEHSRRMRCSICCARDGRSAAPRRRSPRVAEMAIFENLSTLSGEELDESSLQGRAVLVVNVASRCGLSPQYTGLEQLQERYGDRGFTVLGVPCNQFGEQEPGSAQEIQTFCSTTYGVSFPMTEKLEVNGPDRHP